MKTLKTAKSDSANHYLIQYVLEFNTLEYQTIKMEALLNYAREYSLMYGAPLDAIITSESFEAWFMNGFARRNWNFVHKNNLRTYLARKKVGRKVRDTIPNLRLAFISAQTVTPDLYYPDNDIVNEIIKEANNGH